MFFFTVIFLATFFQVLAAGSANDANKERGAQSKQKLHKTTEAAAAAAAAEGSGQRQRDPKSESKLKS